MTIVPLAEADLPIIAYYQGCTAKALTLLMDAARTQGYSAMTAQVRTDNAASMALHRSLGFAAGANWINRKGNEVVTWRKEL